METAMYMYSDLLQQLAKTSLKDEYGARREVIISNLLLK